ncbi:PREDICTED: uncharacterized protein LOC103339654 [Prunus mume]|uniref:Uncharacterized protein LOC103339654 n=1 Tax=Prunus mume TaxID=102107 RepID=A0ABM0PL60_PRUMU|nr:PREDICTED: uncharacterized protein LOC103339654 [Prunus mume]
MWTDVGSLRYDVVGVLGLLQEQKLTATLWMLAYRASAKHMDEIAKMEKSTILKYLVRFCNAVENLYTREYLRKLTHRDLQRLLQKAKARGFLGLIGNIDCMHGNGRIAPLLGKETMKIERAKKVFRYLANLLGYYYGCCSEFDEEVLRSIMITCIILHNIIVEDEFDYDAPKVFEPDPMNTTLTRIYERPMGPNGNTLEQELLVWDGRFNNPMLDRYQEMQSSYVHEKRQVDLIEHLWEMKGNYNG